MGPEQAMRAQYREACTNARATAGSVARNPADAALAQVLAEARHWALMLGELIGKTPEEVDADCEPLPRPPWVKTL